MDRSVADISRIMSSGLLPRQLDISGTSARDGAQVFAGINLGSIHFADTEAHHKTSDKEVSACRNALFLTDPHIDRENLISTKGKRVPGTCEWIRENDIYRSWLHGDEQLLWISGGPGKGKTMLSIFLTEELESISQGTESVELLFYFCSHQDEKRNTAVAILRGLVYQIIVKRPNLTKHLLSYFETPEKVQSTLSSLEALWIIFRKLLQDPDLGTVFCVVDGLDECDEGSSRLLMAKLVDFFSSQNSQPTNRTFKLVIVSREISGLHGISQVKLDPDYDERVTSDIERFISVRVEELLGIEGINKEFCSTIQATLLERARGTFLWVGFIMNELSQKKTYTEVLETLRALPRGLPALYSRMLLQIESSRRRTSSRILRWVTMAIRPLTLQELAVVIGIQSSAFITTEQAVRDQIAFCGPFLKVHEQAVALIHQSARNYLLREEPAGNLVLEEFRIKPEEAHLELARTCFDCLEYSALQHAPLDITDASCLPESPLLLYAALYWPEHVRCCSTYAKELLDLSRPFFQKESGLRRNWWESYRKRDAWLKASPLPLLHMASYFGIVSWVRLLLVKKTWKYSLHKLADKKDILDRTPLIYAARSGHEAVVRLLLEQGADIEAEDKENGQTALIYATISGHETVVRLLLERGANVEAKDKERGWTALIWAAGLGHKAVAQLLLERGADVEVKDKKSGWTALICAAISGHETVVRLLLKHRADIEAKDIEGVTVLISAAESGQEAVARLLLERGADIEAKEKERGGTALVSAALSGHKAVVRLLLEQGADVEAKKEGRTALIWAAELGHETVVRLLLERGADIEAKNTESGRPALIYAVISGHEGVVRLLLERGADVEAKDKEGKTALIWAAGLGHEAVVRLLLERRADVEAKDKERGRTALVCAAVLGHEAVVRLLLERGADVEAKDKEKEWTMLIWTAWSGLEAIVQLLLERGADVEAKDKERGRTALIWAVGSGHKTIVQLLLEHGADVEAKDKELGGTALIWAAGLGNKAITRLLLEHGADVEAKDREKGWTALLYAARAGYEAVVRLLLERGANVEAKDIESGQTALVYTAVLGHIAVIRLLLERGTDVETKDKESGRTALIYAAISGYEAVVRLLLERGADIEAKDKERGWTALIWAAGLGHEVVVQLLLERGADVEVKDKESGWTALICAAISGHEAVVRLLLRRGADIEAKDKGRGTALIYAAESGHKAVVRLLKSARAS